MAIHIAEIMQANEHINFVVLHVYKLQSPSMTFPRHNGGATKAIPFLQQDLYGKQTLHMVVHVQMLQSA